MSDVKVSGQQTTISTATVSLEFDAGVFNSADYFEVEVTIFPTDRMVDYNHLRPVTKKIRLNSRDLYRLGLTG